ncbi:MFS transporter [Bacteroidetes/Chlorobi group bacterium Naka2016]|jgi:DHA1 family multidrug resistance protein-like MFS transporter|nr:MAG: MFS transporter [Bacteroidetes/Chlorobi group bacterium Naka2016]
MGINFIAIKHRFQETWERNLLFLALSQFIAMMGMNACVPFLPLYIRELGVVGESAQRFWSGLVFAGPYFLSIIFVPIWGNLGDRYGKKLMIIRAIFGLALAMFLMGFAKNVWQLFLLRVFQGASSGFIAANLGFAVANTPEDKKGSAVGFLQSSQSAGALTGPLLGGFISDIFGFREVFFVVAALCLVSAILIIFFVKEINKTKENQEESIIDILKLVVRRKDYRNALIMIVIGQVGIFLTFPIIPYYLEQLNVPKEIISSATGIAIGITSAFNIIFAPIWGRWADKTPITRLLKRSVIILSIGMFLHSIAFNYLLIYPIRIVLGISIAGLVPLLYSYLGKIAEPERIGSIMGFASSATLFGSLLAYLGSAFVAPLIELEWLFVISSGILLSILFFIKSNSKDSEK